TGGSGFSAAVEWDGTAPLHLAWNFGLRGSHSLNFVPRGGQSAWAVSSTWQHPGFTGSFLPDSREVTEQGFTASYDGITNLALGRPLAATADDAAPISATIGLVDPV